jgi:hypothetical protein
MNVAPRRKEAAMSTPSTSPFHGPATRDTSPGLGRLFLGLAILTLGVVLLLGSAGVLDSGQAIDRWWPVAILAAGLMTLAERPPAVLRGLLLAIAGGVLLLFTTDTIDESAWDYLWPAALIGVGAVLLLRWRGRALPGGAGVDDDVVRATAVFGGPHLVSTSPRFRGGWLTAVFGGITLDLRQAQLDPGGASINATAAFGGIEILVPRGWRITMRSTPVLGGTEDKTDRAAIADDAPTLRIDAITILGGLEVKHEK